MARRRWRWLFRQLRSMAAVKEFGSSAVRVQPNLSVASRANRVEYQISKFPRPEELYEVIRAIPELKERMGVVEAELPKLWKEIDGLQYLKDEVAKHGREIEASKEKIQKNAKRENSNAVQRHRLDGS